MKRIIIGIDPDIDKNGIAVLYPHNREISIYSLPLGQALAFIESLWEKCNDDERHGFVVVVEAGWRNKGNYHLTRYDSKESAAKKGMDQGRNHQRGIDIVEYLQYHKIPVEEMKPLPLLWKKGKISHKEITGFMPIAKHTSNQEERDAAMIAWVYSGLPIHTKVN